MEKFWKIIKIAIIVLFVGGAVWYNLKPASPELDTSGSPSDANTAGATLDMSTMYASMVGEEFDRAYLADMTAHHQGALNMASQARELATRPEIRRLSDDIIAAQAREVEKMISWQQTWGFANVDVNNPHAAHIEEMSKVMSQSMAEMEAKLVGLDGESYDKEFLKQMILHHKQAVDMSKFADSNAQRQEIKDLARTVIDSQNKEIEQMKRWQKDWGYV